MFIAEEFMCVIQVCKTNLSLCTAAPPLKKNPDFFLGEEQLYTG